VIRRNGARQSFISARVYFRSASAHARFVLNAERSAIDRNATTR
jgi:hypothetical protein